MPLQTIGGTGYSPGEVFDAIRSLAFSAKSTAQNTLTSLQQQNVSTLFVFQLLDQIAGFVNSLNTWKTVLGLDTYATSQGYTGSLVSDCTTAVTAAQACTAWVVANFPASGGFLQAESLNADGSRTYRTFTPAQTSGLQTALAAFIATIS